MTDFIEGLKYISSKSLLVTNATRFYCDYGTILAYMLCMPMHVVLVDKQWDCKAWKKLYQFLRKSIFVLFYMDVNCVYMVKTVLIWNVYAHFKMFGLNTWKNFWHDKKL